MLVVGGGGLLFGVFVKGYHLREEVSILGGMGSSGTSWGEEEEWAENLERTRSG